MITDLGTLSIAAVVPSETAATAAIDIAVGVAAPNVSAQLTALLGFTPSVNLSYAQQLEIVAAINGNIEAAITAGLEPPSLELQVELAASITATLQAQLGILEAQLAFSASLQALLATGGVRLLKYSGQQDDFGDELDAALGPGTAACNALVLLTTSSATWTAMQAVFKTA